MPTSISSFGFKHGLPPAVKAGIIVDVRDLKNPYHDKHLRLYKGDHPDVIEFFQSDPAFEHRYQNILAKVKDFNGPVYIGCTGGHHRSVYVANRLGKDLGIVVEHLNYNDR